jgi:hypothetical protein
LIVVGVGIFNLEIRENILIKINPILHKFAKDIARKILHLGPVINNCIIK